MDNSPPPEQSWSTTAQFRRLGLTLSLTAALVLFIGFRFSQRGKWLPTVPNETGIWTATEIPLAQSAVQILGGAPAVGRRYTNPLNEKVEAHIIATASFDSYREPTLMQTGGGYTVSAEKRLPLFGRNRYVRAMILKREADGQRVLMYYWVQYRSGNTSTRGILSDYRDLFPRLTVGLSTIITGEQSCIVRAYTQIHPADSMGVQARRNLNEVTLAMYKSFQQNEGR